MNINELKKQLDGTSINALESTAHSHLENYKSAHSEFINILFYLEHTGRFKENKNWRSVRFPEYVQGEFGISYGTYYQYRMVYFRFPDEAKEHGVGTIRNIINKCGLETVPLVVDAIDKIKKPNSVKVNEVINRYLKPIIKKRKSEPTKIELQQENIALKTENRELLKALNEKELQIEKLKRTVKKYEDLFQGINTLRGKVQGQALPA